MTKALKWAAPAALVLALCPDRVASADTTYMDLSFDDKTIDAPLGQGGTAIGEATWIHENVQATVRATPFDTPSLELHNLHATATGPMQIDLPNGAIGTGVVGILMDLWFYQKGAGWLPYFEFYDSAWARMCGLFTEPDGSLRFLDGEGSAFVPDYPVVRPLRIVYLLDMDADTYSAWVDGVQRAENRPLEVTGMAIERLVVQTGFSCAPENRFSIDRILVVDYLPPVPVQPMTWGGIKTLFGVE